MDNIIVKSNHRKCRKKYIPVYPEYALHIVRGVPTGVEYNYSISRG